jgi:hypothetical protein
MISAVSIPVEITRRYAKVDVAELALDHIQGDTLMCHLDGVSVAKLVRGEAAADAGLRCDAS